MRVGRNGRSALGKGEVIGRDARKGRVGQHVDQRLLGSRPDLVQCTDVGPVTGAPSERAFLSSESTLHRFDDLSNRDEFGISRERVTAVGTGTRGDESRPLQLLEHLVQKALGNIHRRTDLGGLGGVTVLVRKKKTGTNGVVGASGGDELHTERIVQYGT